MLVVKSIVAEVDADFDSMRTIEAPLDAVSNGTARLETVIFLVVVFAVSTIGITSLAATTAVPAYDVSALILVSLMTRLLFSSLLYPMQWNEHGGKYCIACLSQTSFSIYKDFHLNTHVL